MGESLGMDASTRTRVKVKAEMDANTREKARARVRRRKFQTVLVPVSHHLLQLYPTHLA